MQRNLNQSAPRSRYAYLGLVAMVAVLLSACGPLGGEDDDPTATVSSVSQPTEGSSQGSNATPDAPPFLPDDELATPESPLATPAATVVSNNPPGIEGTPAGSSPSDGATPVVTGTDGPPATPATASENTSFAGSDGTSGATPALDVSTAPEPEPTVAEGDGTPVAEPGATPDSVALADLETTTVTSCEPDTIPPLASTQTQYLTAVDVNFRTGPGSDCETIGSGPIGTNIPVTVLSGPVVREGEEDFTWVQVQIVDDIGWVIIGVLEPAA